MASASTEANADGLTFHPEDMPEAAQSAFARDALRLVMARRWQKLNELQNTASATDK